MNRIQKLFAAIAFGSVLIMPAYVSAHIVVRPGEVLTSSKETFFVSVPNEHDTPVVSVRLLIPEGLESVRPFAKAGWVITVKTTGKGEDASATEIIWTGGSVPVDLKDDFLFGAKAPSDAMELNWKVYETYADGTVVAWDQTPSDAEDNKPYSVTKVVNETGNSKALAAAEIAAVSARTSARRALIVAVISLALALGAGALAFRRR